MKHSVIIDWVRGLSVLVVIGFHTTAYYPSVIAPFGPLAWNGYFGVTAFFCTSGFLITANLLRRYDQVAKVNLYTFYVMRFGRIAPPLALLCVVLILLSKTSLETFIFPPTLSMRRLLMSILTLKYNHYYQQQDGRQVIAWAVLWSLSIEEVFYLGYPLIAKVVGSTQALVAILLGLIARALVHRLGPLSTIYDYFGCFDAIAIGALSAFAAKHYSRQMPGSGAWAFMLVGSAIAAYTYTQMHVAEIYNVGLTLIAMGIGLVLFASQCAPFVNMRLGRYDPLAYCGRLSYEIYLFHMTIYGLLYPLFLPFSTQYPLPMFIICLLCILAASDMIHIYYSQPLNDWLRAKLLSVHRPRVTITVAIRQPLPAEQPSA